MAEKVKWLYVCARDHGLSHVAALYAVSGRTGLPTREVNKIVKDLPHARLGWAV
jgi:hypothetical protein